MQVLRFRVVFGVGSGIFVGRCGQILGTVARAPWHSGRIRYLGLPARWPLPVRGVAGLDRNPVIAARRIRVRTRQVGRVLPSAAKTLSGR
ncbi:hypothetical protein [Nocardia noduli]|uniref:hypothetical protein n=1 Tax=Nocardia noduli TaxID=2815722 RepID=UPI001C2304EE|nr:hypothetical protein [Nocardia noduli]